MSQPSKSHNGHLTSGRLLAKNTVWNLLANGAPLVVAIFCIPVLIRGLGKDRFGVLTLAWALIGYASLFDLGLGRALTQLVSKKLGAGEEHEVPGVVWSSLLLMLGLGVVGAATIAASSPWLVHRLLKIPEVLQEETLGSFYLLAASVPLVIVSAGLRGLLEAHQRFDLVTYVRVPLGVFTFVGPLLVLPFSKSLTPVVGVLVGGRLAGCAAFFWLCLRIAPELRQQVALHGPSTGALLRFGGWLTVANLVNPILVSADRFVIGSLLPVAMVAYYTAPFEAVTKLWILPMSLTATVFPACSALGPERTQQLRALYGRSIRYLFCMLAPLSVVLVVFARPIVAAWLGPGFADKSAVPLQLLAIGVFINCFAHIPYCFLQGLGRPDLTAKLLLAELLPYGLLAWWMIERYGIVGAAAAWSIRVTIEVLLLLCITWRIFSLSAVQMADRKMWTALAALCVVGAAIYVTHFFLQDIFWADATVSAVSLAGFALTVWKWVLDGAERQSALAVLRLLRNFFNKSLETAEAD